jgi:phosphoribosylaminoimidazole-succinocarboxamide synthase
MVIEDVALTESDLKVPACTDIYRGKVRDVYSFDDELLMVATDRISAFDHILPRPIPFKGQILNSIAAHFLRATKDIVPNWLRGTIDPAVSIGRRAKPIKIEMVIRGYLVGHAWREYHSGKRKLCGVSLPEGMKEADPFPEAIITPATKAEEGHDEDISKREILEREIVSSSDYEKLESYTRALYEKGQAMADEQGLILVDTKYEFGRLNNGKIILIDEVHTPDSSRYFYKQGYRERQKIGEKQQQLSKEFVREWLMEQGFQGKEGQEMPNMPDDFVWRVSERYQELYRILIGQPFEAAEQSIPPNDRIQNAVNRYFQ